MRAQMAGGDPSHYTVPGIDQMAPDLKRIIDEALFGSIWTRPVLDVRHRGLCTISALLALGQLPLLRRHVERSLNLGVSPEQIVEVIVLLTFYVGVPAVEAAMRIAKDVFEEQGVDFTPAEFYNTEQTPEQLYSAGAAAYEENIGENVAYYTEYPTAAEMQQLVFEYHWGAIYTRPGLDNKLRALCSLAALTVQGRHDRQIRLRIEGALRVGATPAEIMEVFVQVMLYGGYIATSTVMQIAGSVFNEHARAQGAAD
jgi:4-carboxymuconolactone decarboxylase